MTLAMDGMSSCCQQINAVPPQAMASAATLSISLFLCVFGVSPSLLGMALWGVGLGAQKAILKAAIVGMVPSERRGTAYGLYNAAYGVSWFLGSSLMGWLYGRSPAALAGLSVTAELAAVPLILLVARMQVAADAAIAQD